MLVVYCRCFPTIVLHAPLRFRTVVPFPTPFPVHLRVRTCCSMGFVCVTATWLCFHTGYNEEAGGIFVIFSMLTLFELSLGGYMAAMAVLKATWVPDDMRATIYNIFRVPLNLIVVIINVVSLSSEFTFLSCSALMALGLALALVSCGFGPPNKAKANQHGTALV